MLIRSRVRDAARPQWKEVPGARHNEKLLMEDLRKEEERLGAFHLLTHVRRILGYVGDLKLTLALAILGALVYAGIELGLPLLMRFGVDHYLVPASPGPEAPRLQGLRDLALIYAGLLVVNLGLGYLVTMALNHVGQSVVMRIRSQLWKHIHRLPVSFFDQNPVGRLVTRVANDTNALSDLFTNVLASGLEDTLRVVGAVAVLAWMEPDLSLWVLLVSVPLAAMTWWFKVTSSRMHRTIRVLLARVNAFLQENVQGVAVVKSFAAEAHMQGKFRELNRDFYQAEMSLVYLNAIFRPFISGAATVAIAVVLWRGSHAVVEHGMTLGTLIAYLFYLRMVFSPLEALAEKFNILQGAAVASERLFHILGTAPEPGLSEAPPGERSRGHIVFEHVSFAYDPAKPVLDDISFEIQPGQTVALVGPSGSGKTTITALLLGFYRLQGQGSGTISLDGRRLEDWNLADLRRQFALVP
ncbi:MAG: ABC transporter transmembrane domain-containing protein, partial [Candidatus Eremiobacterota bacterium]